ncbi:MAG: ABC transporter ATP-binding protein [Luteimonas sp.]
MSMLSNAITVEEIGKLYRLEHVTPGSRSFRDLLTGMATAPFRRLRRLRGTDETMEDFWALRDVSFGVAQGEVVGIIGHNGAGKSTLLKVLSRIVEPTCGQVRMRGRIASLLEVGTGFHPELSGRENIYLNGSILGMKRREIDARFDEIVSFAEVERFLDTPVKRYSSGMYVRLAFSVAAHLEPEILIIDEVLAVGDIQFQKKCLGKMGDVSRSGRTVLFVSHNMAAVRQLTNRCILLQRGRVSFDGLTGSAIDLYAEAFGADFKPDTDLSGWPRPNSELGREVEFRSLSFGGHLPLFEPEETMTIEVLAHAEQTVETLRISGTLFNSEGLALGTFFSADASSIRAGEEKRFQLRLERLRLAPGIYSFGLALVQGNEITGLREFDIVRSVLRFEVSALSGDGGTVGKWYEDSWGFIRFDPPKFSEWSRD